ncbi:MAG: hypothetical protein HUU49_04915 [Candidatus Buchananbacteria bacterium]|nr:hypothetical protein [Candidatus Buchananbacteria bacterium]
MGRAINSIVTFLNHRPYILYCLLFIIGLGIFGYLHFDQTFADPDSFYHAKLTEFLITKGAITEFPWLSVTTLARGFIDHHFLYHILLVPFVLLLTPLIGLKVFTVIFSSLTILALFWFLRSLQVRGAFWYALFLITVNPFVFRLSLAKAQQVVLLLLFLFLFFLLRRNYIGLILVSCVYVWSYAGWPLLLLLGFLYAAVNWFWNISQRGWFKFKLDRLKLHWQNAWLLLSIVIGLAAGLFFSPYFPTNLNFYWQQSFKIAVVNYQYIIDVGAEWYPYSPLDLLASAIPFFALVLIALLAFIIFYDKQPMNSWFFLVVSFLFFALTLKSRRYVEYFIPLALIFSALSLNVLVRQFEGEIVRLISRKYLWLLFAVIVIGLIPVAARDLASVKDFYRRGFAFNKFEEPARWLKENSQPGDVVFHSDWDEFPILFYHNDQNYYLVGLDPTFMYEYDPGLHQRWVDIVTGHDDQDLYVKIKNLYNARYVFVDIKQNESFANHLADEPLFEEVFSNQEAKIYRLNE